MAYKNKQSGAITLIMGLMVPLLLTTVGLAVDLSKAYVARDRLLRALDTSALSAAASSTDAAVIEDKVHDFLAANYPDTKIGDPFNINVVVGENTVTVTAQARVDTSFMRVVGKNYIDVSAETVVQREVRGLEVALVLDNTGSMDSGGKIAALRTAATSFVNIIYDKAEYDDQVKVALVPYVTSVNMGDEAASVTNNPYTLPTTNSNVNTAYAPYNGAYANNRLWRGCVLERPYPHDVQDSNVALGGQWSPYRWRSNPSVSTNRWINTSGNVSLATSGRSCSNTHRTPNLGCPQPIVPLNSNRTSLLSNISSLDAVCGGSGGTFGNVGMAWGIRVLSPDAPFTQGAAYSNEFWRKAIVMMTDGDNTFFTGSSAYGAYHRTDGTITPGMNVAALNTRMLEACNLAKQNGIIVYTITFPVTGGSISTATQNLYRSCATDAGKYYNAPSSADLVNAFEKISRELANLHISH